MFEFEAESERRVQDDEELGTGAPRRVQRQAAGPSFAAQRNPPWDPLSGQPPPWGGTVWDPITAGTAGPREPPPEWTAERPAGLDPGLRARAEHSLGVDLGQVQVHQGARAQAANA